MSEIPLTNLDSVLTSIHQAKGLPNDHYISDTVFEEEKIAVLFNNWSAIGFGKDIPVSYTHLTLPTTPYV